MQRVGWRAVGLATIVGLVLAASPVAAAEPVPVAVVREHADGIEVEQHLAASLASARRYIDRRLAQPDVVAAEIDVVMHAVAESDVVLTAVAEPDPLRGEQWPLDRLGAETTWRYQRARGRTIAVVDSGVDASHPDLAAQVIDGFDAFDAKSRGRVDPNGHGTLVAGVAAATVGNGIGIAGMARDARILPVRVLDRYGAGLSSDVARGIEWAADHGAAVINLSLGAPEPSAVVEKAIDHAVAKGSVVVAAAGNTGRRERFYPAAHPNVIAVGATNRQDRRPDFSTRGSWLDLAAPGVSVLSTAKGGGYEAAHGTSMAAPYVAATAALVRARHPGWTPARVRAHLTATAIDLGVAGRDAAFGHGLVDPVAALPPMMASGCRTGTGSERVTRVWGSDRVETAVAVSCTYWPHGADAAVLATAADFPDALAGSAVAAAESGPLLLTARDRLPAAVRAELVRLGVGRVTILGGPAAVSAAVAQELTELGVQVERVAGDDRWSTAAAAAVRAGAQGAEEVVLASGRGFADAVSAGALAALPDGPPVLLTDGARLPAATATALRDLEGPSVLLVGGPSAVSDAVVRQLGDLGLQVRRLAGTDRYQTSVRVVEEALARAGGGATRFVYATGADFPDALSAGALAASLGAPVLLVPPRQLPAASATHRLVVEVAADRRRGVVVGGASAVAEVVHGRLYRLSLD